MKRGSKTYHTFACPKSECVGCYGFDGLLSAFAERSNSRKNLLIISGFLEEKTGDECAERICSRFDFSENALAAWFLNAVAEVPEVRFLEIVRSIKPGPELVSADIPQISSFDEVVNVSQIVAKTREVYTFEQMGSMLNNAMSDRRRHWAKIKYGENHSKFAAMMGIADVRKDDRNHYVVSSTGVGRALYLVEDAAVRNVILRRLMFRCRAFRILYTFCENGEVLKAGLKALEQTTRLRRLRTLKALARAYNSLSRDGVGMPQEAMDWLGI